MPLPTLVFLENRGLWQLAQGYQSSRRVYTNGKKKIMFRCDNCGSGYSSQATASWASCPRCLAKEKIQVPLTFELGWQRQEERGQETIRVEKTADTRVVAG
jgi:protein-arginine kinase activator protein McsA